MAKNAFAPVTPGEMLKEEFLVEYGLSQNHLAKAIGISPNRIAEIVNNRRRITADTALRLSLYFGNSPEFWMNLQTHYDLKMARQNLDPKPSSASRLNAQLKFGAYLSGRPPPSGRVCCQSCCAIPSGSTLSCCHHVSSSPRWCSSRW